MKHTVILVIRADLIGDIDIAVPDFAPEVRYEQVDE